MVLKMSGTRTKKSDFVGLATAGMVLLLLAALYIMTPNIFSNLVDFFSSFELLEIAPGYMVFRPSASNALVYAFVFQFCAGIAMVYFFTVLLHLLSSSPLHKTGSSFIGTLTWFGFAWSTYLLLIESLDWVTWMGYMALVLGFSIVIGSQLIFLEERFRK